MLKPALAVASIATLFTLALPQPTQASNESGGVVRCNPSQLQPVVPSAAPDVAIQLGSGETAHRDYDIPNSDVRVSLSMSYAPIAQAPTPSAQNNTIGRVTIAKAFYNRSAQTLMMVVASPSTFVVREGNAGLELASNPISAGSPSARLMIGNNGGPIPRFAVDCEVAETR